MTALPRPRDVPGYAAAAAAGLTPARPAEPPSVRRPTACQMILRFAATVAVFVVVSMLCAFFAPVQDRLGSAAVVVSLAVLTIGFFPARAALVGFRVVFLGELQAGYVTFTFLQGMFWRNGSSDADVIGWDWSGLWTLTSDGRVMSTPDLSVDPPGVYPSPNGPGRRELWTGSQWGDVFFDEGHR